MTLELHLDWETFSTQDLPKVGAYRYAEDPSTEILLAAYYLHDSEDRWLPSEDEVKQWSPAEGEAMPADLRQWLQDPEVLLIAWNAAFERAILVGCLSEFDLPISRIRCAMVGAMSVGFPGKLEKAGPAIGLPEDLFKQEGGSRLISKFCKPRKPSKRNAATRWTPTSAPEDWAQFKRYNRQDIVAEVAVWQKLRTWRLLPEEQRLWEIDQAMNDRGIQVDVELAQAAHEMGLEHRARLVERAKEITGLDNPNSVKQLVEWLNTQKDFDPEEENDEVRDLRKKTVEKILGREDLDDVVREVLELRQQIAKASLKKYDTLLRATCRDGRIRGTMQFGGANRTMRWAGRLLQVQNLPQGIIEDRELLAVTRELVKRREYEALIDMFGEAKVPEVLATLIRTCLIAAPGKRLIVADLSAIEARVTAWFAKCEWRLEVFRTHGRIYEASAATAFGVPFQEFIDYKKRTGKHHPLRKKGKVIELACLAGDTKVLTPRGYVALLDVTLEDKVWDGKQWTNHRGLIYRGEKETINFLGVKVTPDHLIATGKTWTQAQELVSNESTRCLALATGSENLPYSVPFGGNKGLASSTSSGSSAHAGPYRTKFRSAIFGMAEALVAMLARRKKPEPQSSCFSNTQVSARMTHTAGASLIGYLPATSDATLRTLDNIKITGAEGFMSSAPGGKIKALFSPTWSVSKGGTSLPLSLIGLMLIKAMSLGISASSPNQRTRKTSEKSPISSQKLPVFDLLFCGPRNAFTILSRKGPLLVHNCGYQGGPNAMITMGALEQGLSLNELPPMVDAWRKASPEIAGKVNADGYWEGGLWRDVENAVKTCLRTRVRQEVAGVIFRIAGGNLVITLPSGRHMHYVKARLVQEGRRWQIRYLGVDQKTKRWGEIDTYGGKLCIAKGTPVLTRRGWRPIQNVLPFEEVWDGEEWVRQEGAIRKGVKETMKAHGVWMTPDHEILTEKGWKRASQSQGYNRASCRLPDGYEVYRFGREGIDLGGCTTPRNAAVGTVLQSEEVFDLINCGPRHRFVVADEDGQPLIVHNCENIVQAFSRDLLREILFALDDKRYHPVMLVHDEGVFEEDENHGSLGEVLEVMGITPKYAAGLPLEGDGFENDFYWKG